MELRYISFHAILKQGQTVDKMYYSKEIFIKEQFTSYLYLHTCKSHLRQVCNKND